MDMNSKMSFEYCGSNSIRPLICAIEYMIDCIPIIGDPKTESLQYLAHYSKNPSIQEFLQDSKYSWTSKVSDDPIVIENLIGMLSEKYRAIYIIKLDLGSHYTRFYDNSLMKEYAIDMSLKKGDYGVVNISYDTLSGKYSVT